jgi:hypothetical protein
VSDLGRLLFNVFIKDLCDGSDHRNNLVFVDNFELYRATSSPTDCFLLRSDTDCVNKWCSENFMKPNYTIIRVVSFSSFILWTDCIVDLGGHVDCKIHFHRHVGHLFSHSLKLLWLIRTITTGFHLRQSIETVFYCTFNIQVRIRFCCLDLLISINLIAYNTLPQQMFPSCGISQW